MSFRRKCFSCAFFCMKSFLLLIFLFPAFLIQAQIGYQIGDTLPPIQLWDLEQRPFIPLEAYPQAKGIVIVFSSVQCPYSRQYLSQMESLYKQFAPQGYPLLAVSANNPQLSPADSLTHLIPFLQEHAFSFPYLLDPEQNIARTFGATRTPQAFVLKRLPTQNLQLVYIGAIDDGPEGSQPYLQVVLDQLLADIKVDLVYTRANGCGIKWLQ